MGKYYLPFRFGAALHQHRLQQFQNRLVRIEKDLHREGESLTCLYSTDPAQIGQKVMIKQARDEIKAVVLTVPPAGFVIYE
jgi:hypothetical protein